MIKNVYCCLCEVPVILVSFQRNSHFLDTFSKNSHLSNLMQIRRVGEELYPADRRTDMTQLTVSVRSVANAHKDCACQQLLAPNLLFNTSDFVIVIRMM